MLPACGKCLQNSQDTYMQLLMNPSLGECSVSFLQWPALVMQPLSSAYIGLTWPIYGEGPAATTALSAIRRAGMGACN